MGRFKPEGSYTRSRSWNISDRSGRHRGSGGGGGGGGGGGDKYSHRHGAAYSSSRSRSRSRSHSRSRSPASSFEGDERGYRLHIADLPVDATRKDLEICFSRFGRLVEVWLARSPQCFAFVVFEHKNDAYAAIGEMNSKKFLGQRLRVTKARPRTRGQRTYRGYNPELRCYECGKKGHFSRDCRLNDKSSPKTRDLKTMSIKDLINWDITDEDIIRFNQVYHSPRARSRSRSNSSSDSESPYGYRRRSSGRFRPRSSSSDDSTKDENANSTKGEHSGAASTSASKSTPTSPALPKDHRQITFGIKSVVTTLALTSPDSDIFPVRPPSPKELPPDLQPSTPSKEPLTPPNDSDHPLPGSYLHPKLTGSLPATPELRTVVFSKTSVENADELSGPEHAISS